ncbi:acyl-CoA dehydrogenase family protein [Pseudomonas chlororaphis]|uniref:acyl-CoA dehydrogenase family protein n=1 Tax=Pseudomonas chlororaphis TaxID=587753 RepID=UPI001B30F178|nr:acyl-CoA dehydrogenase family protein [Pseudomonas chlororaphis]MBP5058837.1 acyl-CoA dehydrogenase [Pseudomonas chlororaphis]MBP5142955.1 acyl-CoA dehydrogenase [Pseudomonas chlororaphis]QTT98281.1 acyl-CoA dehydrogenase [Pseudomonas chlororaphis]
MTDNIFDGFERALLDLCPLDQLRVQESPEAAAILWQRIDALGYTDALVAERHGGAGLPLAQVQALLYIAGKSGLSLPLGETAVARALLADAGYRNDGSCIAMAKPLPLGGAEIICPDVPGAALVSRVLVNWRGEWLLLAREDAQALPGGYRRQASASLQWASADRALLVFSRPEADVESICNALHAAAMAGAMERILAITVEYAQDRHAFGKPIGKFQAVQQELAVLSEQACSAALAARMGCMSAGYLPDRLLAATAKLRASEAAARIAAIAHSVLGAIGITQEHPLGLFTARLHEWRATAGTELRCAKVLGQAILDDSQSTLFDFVRNRLSPSAAL